MVNCMFYRFGDFPLLSTVMWFLKGKDILIAPEIQEVPLCWGHVVQKMSPSERFPKVGSKRHYKYWEFLYDPYEDSYMLYSIANTGSCAGGPEEIKFLYN